MGADIEDIKRRILNQIEELDDYVRVSLSILQRDVHRNNINKLKEILLGNTIWVNENNEAVSNIKDAVKLVITKNMFDEIFGGI